ncbi:MAG: EAL domain-containing protein [Halofilum sp. (in: g-proteobacteria)]|nr:EAL domain-containing protein [Halofilum sp. (in: g-proteobacteria)]
MPNALDRMLRLPDVRGIALYSASGDLLGSAGNAPPAVPASMAPEAPRLVDDRVLDLWTFGEGPARRLAVVSLDASGIDSALLNAGLRIIGLVLIICLFVTVVTMTVVGNNVLRPLNRITRAVREARRTGRRETVDPRQPGEFGELVAYYNATLAEQEQAEERGERLFYQAMHDPLTGLPNRALLTDRLQQALERASRYGEHALFLLLDIDRFKLFNDTHGHAAGDALLQAVARRIRETLRTSDTVARLGGDEFAVIEPRIDPESHGGEIGERLLRALKEPFEINGVNHVLTASVGSTLLPEDGGDSDTLIVNADVAMYCAKHDGGDRICRFRPDMRDDMLRRVTLEQELEAALEEEQFELHYQPIVDCASRETVAFEALVRWQHPDWGLVPPNHFLPVVEQTGMIVALGDWVLARAVRDLPALQQMAPTCDRVAVNVAARQLATHGADELVERALAGTSIDPAALTLEITESEVLDSPEKTIAGLGRAAELGVRIAIDDFGTGYSSLAQVQDLPGHILKIDRRFVMPLAQSQRARDLFSAVVAMGRSLGMKVIAEGVETEAQFAIVRDCGCDRGQGFLLGMPEPLASDTVCLRAATGKTRPHRYQPETTGSRE